MIPHSCDRLICFTGHAVHQSASPLEPAWLSITECSQSHRLQLSPDGTAAYAADDEIVLHCTSSGASVRVRPDCGRNPMICFSPSSSHLLVAGQATASAAKAAFVANPKPPTASASGTLSWVGVVRQVAWGTQGHAAITSIGERTGKLALYRVTEGPPCSPCTSWTPAACWKTSASRHAAPLCRLWTRAAGSAWLP